MLIFLLYFFPATLFSQQKHSPSFEIACLESKLTPFGTANFKLLISNITTDTFTIPNKILTGHHIGFEVKYIDENVDTTDLTKNYYTDIQHCGQTLPWGKNKNEYKLILGVKRILDQSVDNNLLKREGTYLVRFILKKEFLFCKNVNLTDDVSSAWIKIIKTKETSKVTTPICLNTDQP